MIKIIWVLIQTAVLTYCSVLAARHLMHMLQLESYQLPGYWKSVRRNLQRTVLPPAAMAAAGTIPLLLGIPGQVCLILEAAVAFMLYRNGKQIKEKKPFVVTERVRRLMLILLILVGILELVLLANWQVLGYLLPAALAGLLDLAERMAEPMEKRINLQFVEDAKARLARQPDLIRIGITGSYGKTSTKVLLREILSVRYNVLATPGSFNTTMGVTRVIREQLMPAHQVFIAEMGARHPGDIAELVDLVHPSIGVVTSVGAQHLDTFGNIDTIRKTKYELIEGLPSDGTAVFAKDGGICDELFAGCTLEKKYQPGQLIRAEYIHWGPEGTRFNLVDVATGESRSVQTRLLGEHSISNLLLCCTVAASMGLTLEEIAMGISRCRPVEHRLQLLDSGAGGVSIIDDAFNANPAGAAAALRVLKDFPGRRIIVTPGLVELGNQEEALNRELGRQMAQCVDVAILVGRKHTIPIAEGLREAGFEESRLHVVGSLDESSTLLSGMMQPGDVILYENDLPDNYSET